MIFFLLQSGYTAKSEIKILRFSAHSSLLGQIFKVFGPVPSVGDGSLYAESIKFWKLGRNQVDFGPILTYCILIGFLIFYLFFILTRQVFWKSL